jgi:hypothetical protein
VQPMPARMPDEHRARPELHRTTGGTSGLPTSREKRRRLKRDR